MEHLLQWSKCSIFHYISKYIVFQRRQKALLWSKGVIKGYTLFFLFFQQNKVIFNVEIPTSQRDPRHCPVMEQKEYGSDKKDEACGKDSQKGMAGLCE